MLAKPVKQLSEINSQIQKGLAADEDIFEQIDSEPKNKDSLEYKIWYGNFVADKLAQTASYDSIKLQVSK